MLKFTFDNKLDNCILCGSNNIKNHLVDFNGIKIDICNDCGFQFMNPQYTDEYLNEYYAQYSNDDGYNYWKEAAFYGHGFYLSRVEKYLPPGKLLDIGCGNGHLLEAAKHRGWATTGYDVDEDSTRRIAERLNITVHSGNFITTDLGNAYNLVCMHQVLEHLKDPNTYLKKVNDILSDDGYLFIAVPNIKSLSNKLKRFMERIGLRRKNIGKYYDSSHHLLYFEPDTLKKLLERHGFSVVYKRNCHTVRPKHSRLKRFILRNITEHFFAKSAFFFIAKKIGQSNYNGIPFTK